MQIKEIKNYNMNFGMPWVKTRVKIAAKPIFLQNIQEFVVRNPKNAPLEYMDVNTRDRIHKLSLPEQLNIYKKLEAIDKNSPHHLLYAETYGKSASKLYAMPKTEFAREVCTIKTPGQSRFKGLTSVIIDNANGAMRGVNEFVKLVKTETEKVNNAFALAKKQKLSN